MAITKMGVFRQNYIKLVGFLMVMLVTFRLISLSTLHHKQLLIDEEESPPKEFSLTKEDVNILRLFKRENIRAVINVMEKLSNFLNKSNPVVNIRLEMKTEETMDQPGMYGKLADKTIETMDQPGVYGISADKAIESSTLHLLVKTDQDDFSDIDTNSISLRRNLESKDYAASGSVITEKPENKTRIKRNRFVVSLSSGEKQLLYEAVEYFTTVCAKLNVSYLMYGGTLLGSWRHHDIIPWDDDVDLQVNIRDRDELYSALSIDSHQFQVMSAGPRLKLFSRAGKKTSRYPWLWPYIDIHFYKENDTHIRDSSKEFSRYIYEKSILFPPHLRPLGPLNLSAPRDSYAALRQTYRGLKCETYSYSHKLETVQKVKKTVVPCETFRDQVPFVHRKPSQRGMEEVLMLGDAVIQTVLVAEPDYAVTDPYSLNLLQ